MTILNLYPDLLHTNGCGGSALALRKRLKWRGIDAKELIFTVSDKEFPTEQINFMIIGDGSPRETAAVTAHLTKFVHEIKEYIEAGGAVFASGSGFAVLGEIGALNIKVTPSKSRIIGDILVQTDLFPGVIIGFENHTAAIDIGNNEPLGTVMRGAGNNGEDGRDGLVYKGTICTNAGGPTLAKNPQLCDCLIKTALGDIEELDDSIEDKVRQFALNFLAETAVSAQAKCIDA